MIHISPTKTQLEINLSNIDAPLSLLENNIRSAINNLNESFTNFWKLPDDQIEEILNYHGPVEMNNIFTAHYTYGVAMNTLLEDRGIDSPRAVLVKPREITMDENGKLRLVPIMVEEILEEPIIQDPEIIV